MKDPVQPRAFGGWLILAMLSLFGITLRLVATAIPIALELRKVPDLSASIAADPRWFALNGFDLAVGIILTGTSLFAMPAFFGKKKVAIMRMQIVFACVLCTNVVTPLIIATQSAPETPATSPMTSFWPVVLPLLWINYFRTSPRVKETFVR